LAVIINRPTGRTDILHQQNSDKAQSTGKPSPTLAISLPPDLPLAGKNVHILSHKAWFVLLFYAEMSEVDNICRGGKAWI
jgi:hypothetical protein